ILQEKVFSQRRAEYKRLKEEKEEGINQIIRSRKQEREAKRKMIYYLRSEEEKPKRLQDEEEARKLEEMERRKKEDAERKAKLDEIAEKQRQRELELEEKENKRREELLGRSSMFSKAETSALNYPADATPAVPVAVDAASSPAKYVPKFRKMAAEFGGGQAPPRADKCFAGSKIDDRLPQQSDRWRDDRRPSYGGGNSSSRQSWSSTRA
ncbi:eukaryotic translation initiation factor 3 subunit A-like, partial [Dorcoceras hygrometricum]